jgi:excinuclease ABC subunit A
VHFKGLDIRQVLDLTIEEGAGALRRPAAHPPTRWQALFDVGLGYLTLGQPSTTLSGGEAQRVKLAKYLQKNPRTHTLFVLDEPTTGLHGHDVQRLVGALQRLVDQGHTVVVVEHHLDLLRAADHLVDMGPGGGAAGGHIVAQGTPEEVEAVAASATGVALSSERHLADAPSPSRLRPVPKDHIEVVGARTHNLKNVDVAIPRDKLTVVTGPSGSGKSSLALDTIYSAGRQRFVESLSTYARQFLASRDRPPVERIDGLGPAVAVEARTSLGHPRSTVATTTELHDHLRVLWARAGEARCPEHGEKLERKDPGALARRIAKDLDGQSGWLLAPWGGNPAELETVIAAWRAAGFARALVDDEEQRLEALVAAPPRTARIELVVDRLRFGAETRSRLAEAIEQAEALADGKVAVRTKDGERRNYSTRGACTVCGFALGETLEPRHFSFNTHAGACPACDGLGQRWSADAELLIEEPGRPLVNDHGPQTAIGGKLGRYLTKGKGFYEHLLRTVAAAHRIDLSKPFDKLSEKHRALLLHGEGARARYDVRVEKAGATWELTEDFSSAWHGLCGHVDRWHEKSEDPEWRTILERVMTRQVCATCAGERLAPAPRAVTVARLRLPQVLAMDVTRALEWLAKLRLAAERLRAMEPVIAELRARLGLLERVGLGYLTLDRAMSTLSGGEARRVRLSAALGSQLTGVCYVLDEPTVGLHPRDIDRLTGALLELRDRGNTVIVVEHDEDVMRRADHLVELGPGAGRLGGHIVAQGTPGEVEGADTLTGRALRGELALPMPDHPPRIGDAVGVEGARLHNLAGARLSVRYGELTGICGPSGSGKSTLVLDTLVPALRGETPRGRWKSASGMRGGGRRVVVVDSAPLGRTPASVPATAIGLMEPLRELFTRLPEARVRGFGPSAFSFNSPKGRCPACEGKGMVQVEMQFLADLWLTCEECEGRRYRPEVLTVRWRGQSIADLLGLPAADALEHLEGLGEITRLLGGLVEVGLGYLALGQPSTTLSAGEAQRVKLASELLRAHAGAPSVLVLDEPSTGLHAGDVQHLYAALRRLVERGDAVVVIEHHTGLLAACDRLVELGPEGGAGGWACALRGHPARAGR